MLPAHVKSTLGIAPTATPEEQQATIDRIDEGFLGLGFAEDLKKTLSAYIDKEGFQRKVVGYSLPGEHSHWHVQQLIYDSQTVDAVLVPAQAKGAPPALAEQALLLAWMNDPAVLIENTTELKPNIGYLVFSSPNPSQQIIDLSAKVLGFVAGDTEIHPSGIRRHARLAIGDLSPALKANELVGQVFSASVKAQALKWKYVETYRLFEASYLSSILEELSKKFLKDPDTALQTAVKSVENEVASFVGLVESLNLLNDFNGFNNLVDTLCSSNNRFVNAIRHSAEKNFKHLFDKGNGRKGVVIAYKIRCAIVHSGSKDVVFESHPDANDALRALIPVLEDAALHLLKMKPVTV